MVRQMSMVPVTLPSGKDVELSPGGQNPLIKAVIEDFCARFAPGGHVLYIGDTGDKFVVWEQEALAALGVVVNEKGKMPDVVVHDFERGWLLLVEAVTSHGPVDPKRQEELAALFGDCEAGLVYVTAFMDRRTLAERLPMISWETEVWIAEDPTHMIHFDGARFLGPYEATPDAVQSSSDGGRSFGRHVRVSDRSFDAGIGFGSERGMLDLGSRLALDSSGDRALAVWTDTRAGTVASSKQDLARAVVAFKGDRGGAARSQRSRKNAVTNTSAWKASQPVVMQARRWPP